MGCWWDPIQLAWLKVVSKTAVLFVLYHTRPFSIECITLACLYHCVRYTFCIWLVQASQCILLLYPQAPYVHVGKRLGYLSQWCTFPLGNYTTWHHHHLKWHSWGARVLFVCLLPLWSSVSTSSCNYCPNLFSLMNIRYLNASLYLCTWFSNVLGVWSVVVVMSSCDVSFTYVELFLLFWVCWLVLSTVCHQDLSLLLLLVLTSCHLCIAQILDPAQNKPYIGPFTDPWSPSPDIGTWSKCGPFPCCVLHVDCHCPLYKLFFK